MLLRAPERGLFFYCLNVMGTKVKNKISEYREYILLILAVISLLGIVVNAVSASKLAPYDKTLTELTTEVKALEEVKKIEDVDDVHHSEFNQLVTRIDHISSRVDAIYSALVRK